MRFKATLHNTQTLITVLDSLSHLHSLGLFSLSTTGLTISIDTNTTNKSNPENCFVELRKDQLFEQYKIESKADNHLIPFVAQFAALRQALESVRSASEVVLKLVKRKEQAFLQCEASDLPSLTYSQQLPQADGSSSRSQHQVYQFIPIQVLAVPDYLDRASEPELTDPRVKLLMPPLKKLQSILEKMKSVGQTIVEFAMVSTAVSIVCLYRLQHVLTLQPAAVAAVVHSIAMATSTSQPSPTSAAVMIQATHASRPSSRSSTYHQLVSSISLCRWCNANADADTSMLCASVVSNPSYPQPWWDCRRRQGQDPHQATADDAALPQPDSRANYRCHHSRRLLRALPAIGAECGHDDLLPAAGGGRR